MFCNKCGAEIEEGQNFCDQCGTQINNTPKTEVLKDVKSSKLNIYSIIAIMFGFVSIFTCFWWYVSIPIGLAGAILAVIGDKKSDRKKSDYKLLLNVIGVLLSIIIISIGNLFWLLEEEYSTKYYTIRYGSNWNLENNNVNTVKMLYNDNENIYLTFVESSEFPSDLNISNEEDRETLYYTLYDTYKKNAKVGAYYLSTENSEFYKIRGTKDTYIAYISYSAYNGNYGRFYIIASQKNNSVLSFMSCADNKFNETNLHSKVIKLLENIKIVKQDSN